MNKYVKKALKTVLSEGSYNKLQDSHRQSVRDRIAREKIREFHENFRVIMEEHSIYVSGDRTITPTNIKYLNKEKLEGIVCELRFPKGLSKNDLDKVMKPLTQNVFGKCMVLVEDEEGKHVKFAAIKKWHDVKYNPYLEHEGKQLTASQIFIGYNIMLEPIILDMAHNPHLMITGGTGGGKSKLVEIIISNLAMANEPDDLHFYFLQVAKDDNFKFELLKHCKGCVTASSGKSKMETLTKSLAMLRYIDKIVLERGNLVKDKLGRKSEDLNIHVYNKKFPNEKLPVIQLWVDEAASLYKMTSDKTINKMIKEAQEIIERIASTGRYVGVYLINVLQRASKEELPREIKINTMNWITFKQVDAGASKVAIGDETSALGLPQRVFAYKNGTEYVGFGKTPFTMWDINVKKLESQGKIRVDKQYVFDNAYSHWWNASRNTSYENEELVKTKNKNKIENQALKIATGKINTLEEKVQELSYEIQMNEEVIKRLMDENKELKKNNTSVDGESITNKADVLKDTLDIISSLEYKNADMQREEVSNNIKDNNLESSPYKTLDLSKLKFKK